MSDGKLTTIDNTRVVAAREAGIDIQAIIHDANELLPENLIDRFCSMVHNSIFLFVFPARRNSFLSLL